MRDRQQGTFRLGRLGLVVVSLSRWWFVCLSLVLGGCTRPTLDEMHWESLDGPRGSYVVALAKDPDNPRKLYAGMLNGGVLVSTDGGQIWYPIETPSQPRSLSTGSGEPDRALDVRFIRASHNGTLFVATLGQGVYIRTPDGEWSGLRRGLGVSLAASQVAFGGQNREILYAGTQEGVYMLPMPASRSDKWERLDAWGDSSTERVQALFASQEDPPRLYVGTRAGFFHSLDGGETWHRATQGIDREFYVIAMVVDPGNLNHIVVSSWGGLVYTSMDGGDTWQRAEQTFNSVIEEFAFSMTTPGQLYAATYGGSVYASLDGGLNWQLEEQVGASILSFLQTDEGRLVAGTDGQGIFVRDPGGKWSQAAVPGAQLTVQSLLPGDDELYVGTECCGVFRWAPDDIWQDLNSGLPLQARSVTSIVADVRSETLYAGTYGDGVYVRTSGSSRWQALKEGLPYSAWGIQSLIGFQFGSEWTLLAGTNDGLYRLSDLWWEQVDPQQLRETVNNLSWEPRTGTLFAVAGGGQLYISYDGGKSWVPDERAQDRIEYLALASPPPWKRLLLGGARWTLFTLTETDELYYRTSDQIMGWKQVEVEVESGEQIDIWSYPDQPGGFLLVRIMTDDDYMLQQEPPPSLVALYLQQAGWTGDVAPVKAGVQIVVPHARDTHTLYAGTANQGVYKATVKLPSLWHQIPSGSPIKAAIRLAVATISFAALAGFLIWRLSRPPRPVELEIQVEATAPAGHYKISISGPEQISDQAVVKLPVSLTEFQSACDKLFGGMADRGELNAAGSVLFSFCFGNMATADIYTRSKERARRTTLRVRLDVDEELEYLPWEILYDSRKSEFLALAQDQTVTRRATSRAPLPKWNASQRINILIATASPTEYWLPTIEQEVTILRHVESQSSLVHVDVIEHATPSDLLDRLQRQRYQILHYAGHADKDGFILEDGRGHYARLGVMDVAAAVTGPQFRMVFLNACETVGEGAQEGVPSLASMLTDKGVPLVVAMQRAIPDKDALVFVHSFYSELVDTGSVDVAVSKARQAIFNARKGVVPPAWAIPVLLIRGSNSDILRPVPRWRQKLALRLRVHPRT